MSNLIVDQELRQSFVDMGYIRNILAGRSPAVVDKPHAKDLQNISPRKGPSKLEFKNVSFNYNDTLDILADSEKGTTHVFTPYVLHNISISVSPGESVALVGPSGSGKNSK